MQRVNWQFMQPGKAECERKKRSSKHDNFSLPVAPFLLYAHQHKSEFPFQSLYELTNDTEESEGSLFSHAE